MINPGILKLMSVKLGCMILHDKKDVVSLSLRSPLTTSSLNGKRQDFHPSIEATFGCAHVERTRKRQTGRLVEFVSKFFSRARDSVALPNVFLMCSLIGQAKPKLSEPVLVGPQVRSIYSPTNEKWAIIPHGTHLHVHRCLSTV